MKRFWVGALAALSLGSAANAADYFVITVNGTNQPWSWESGGLNDGFQFGVNDGAGPAVFDFSALGIGEGDDYGFLYVGGLVNVYGGSPDRDNNGYDNVGIKNGDLGSSDTYFPSLYMTGDWGTEAGSGVFLGALVGTFANAGGEVLGAFSLGTIFDGGGRLFGFSSALGAGITHAQFGINDDIFADNTGGFQVCIDRADNACFNEFYGGGAVPEPATWAMMIMGFGAAGALIRRRRALSLA